MGAFSLSHILVVALLVIILFGRGKVAELMGDVGKGFRSFKKAMSEDDAVQSAPRVESRAESAPKVAAAAPAQDA